MNEVEIEIVEDNSTEVKRRLEDKVQAILEAVGMFVEGEAKKALSVDPKRIDTGLLRNSITYALSGETPKITSYSADKADKSGAVKSGSYEGTAPTESIGEKAVYIGTNVEYAIYVHEGHRLPGGGHVAPNRFIQNACEWNKGQIERYMEDELKELDN